MQKITKIVLVLSIVFNVGLLIAIFTRNTPVKLRTVSRIDTIIIERDSIREKIDTIISKVRINENTYQEKRSIIIRNSADDDYLFFSNYIRFYDSIQSANQNRQFDIYRTREVTERESASK